MSVPSAVNDDRVEYLTHNDHRKCQADNRAIRKWCFGNQEMASIKPRPISIRPGMIDFIPMANVYYLI